MASLSSVTSKFKVHSAALIAAALLPQVTVPSEIHSLSLSADGQELVYSMKDGGNWHLYLQTVSGAARMRLTDGANSDIEPAFSPDAQQIAFRSTREGGGIFLSDRRGVIRKISSNGFHPAWSPDGAAIVFSTAEVDDPLLGAATKPGEQLGELRILTVATGQQRLLHREADGTEPLEPVWSPDGKRIAYWVGMGGANIIRTVGIDGGKAVDVTDDQALDNQPRWSADGRYVYFESNRGKAVGLWRIPFDAASGKARGQAEPVNGVIDYPDEGRFAVASKTGRIAYTTRRAIQDVQRLTFDPASGSAQNPTTLPTANHLWSDVQPSPDGQTLLLSEESRRGALYIARADGSQLRALTKDPAWYRWPRWSPDGRQVVATVTRLGHQRPIEVRLMTPDGARSQRIAAPPVPVLYPVWEPGGTRLALTDPAMGITTLTNVPPQKPDSTNMFSAEQIGQTFTPHSWSPSGEWLAGDVDPLHGKGLAIYSVQRRELTKVADTGCCAVWLSDSRRILFRDDQRLKLFDLRDRQIREIYFPGADEIVSHSLSRDDRTIFLILRHVESKIRTLESLR